MKLDIYYPSGNHFTVQGKWRGNMLIGDDHTPVIDMDTGEALVLDPRGVIIARNPTRTAYNPMDEPVPKWAADWLSENPHWPPLNFEEIISL